MYIDRLKGQFRGDRVSELKVHSCTAATS